MEIGKATTHNNGEATAKYKKKARSHLAACIHAWEKIFVQFIMTISLWKSPKFYVEAWLSILFLQSGKVALPDDRKTEWSIKTISIMYINTLHPAYLLSIHPTKSSRCMPDEQFVQACVPSINPNMYVFLCLLFSSPLIRVCTA